MNPLMTLPATCELCGNWLPGHSTNCARYGVHPSQWCLGIDEIIDQQENAMLEAFVHIHDINICSIGRNNNKKEDKHTREPSL